MVFLFSKIFFTPLLLILSLIVSLTGLPLFAAPSPAARKLVQAIKTNDCASLAVLLKKPAKQIKQVEHFFLLKAFHLCSQKWDKLTLNDVQARLDAVPWTDFEKQIFAQDLIEYQFSISKNTEDQKDDLLVLEARIPFEKNIHDKEKLIKNALLLAEELKDESAVQRLKTSLVLHSPRLDPEMKEKNPFLVARNFRAWREFPEAIQIYDRVFSASSSDFQMKFEALINKRNTLRSQQLRKEVIEFDKKIISFLEKEMAKSENNDRESDIAQKLADHIHLSARAIWTAGQISAAQTLIQDYLKILDQKANLDEFYFLIGRMHEEKEDYQSALEQFSLIHKKDGDQSLYKRTLWVKGWMSFKLEKYKDAESFFAELAALSEETNERLRSLFWQAESLKRQKKIRDSRKIFQTISKEDPFGYYGIIAHRELKLRFRPLKKSIENIQFSKKFQKVQAEKSKVIQYLIDFGWRENLELALELIKPDLDTRVSELSKNLARNKKHIERLQLDFMLTYAEAGIYLPLFAATSQMKPDERNQLLTAHPEILFPTDFVELIQSASKKFKIDAELILSIIRQESAFNPLAKSHAEAYGLMQMLPSVAAEYAERTGVDYKQAVDLFIPEKNIPLGSSFLSDLYQRRWKQKMIPSIASYNASQKAVQNWIDLRFKGDPLTFIEEVPYEETRGYIKLVLRNYILYKRLLGKKSFLFPEALLEIK